MQTLNFQCGHCRGLMAVGTEFLGQQVRCPHCQQVVIAPQAAAPDQAPAQPGPLLNAPELNFERHDDIFGHHKGGGVDALFGPPEGPSLDAPIQPIQPQPIEPQPLEPQHIAPQPTQPQPAYEEPAPQPAPAPEPAPAPQPAAHTNGEEVPWAPYMPPQEPAPAPAPAQQEQVTAPFQPEATQPAATEAPFTPTRKPREAEGGGMGLLVPFLILPLLLWAIGATAIAYFLYNRLVTAPDPFEQFRDDTGDAPGVNKQKKVTMWDPRRATRPLPDNLLVPLKGTITLGALQVTPLSVQRKKLRIFTEGAEEKPEFLPRDSLVLKLRIKNLAEDYSFTPIDNYFDRLSNGKTPPVPLTVLQAGKRNFFGGPAKWYPLNSRRERGERREWLEGRVNVDLKGLQPGGSMETLVCTNADDPTTVLHLFGENEKGQKVDKPYSGKLLWRVHLRRGLIDYGGGQLPAQCVIGVEFDSKDYRGG